MTTRSIPRPIELVAQPLERAEIWLWPNRLSLQAPIVAVLWQLLLARSLHVSLDPFAPWALGGAVWLIYVADHLVDTARPKTNAVELPRKEFCRRHWGKFLVVAMLACCALAVVTSRVLWAATVRMGWPIAVATGCYFAAIQLTPARWRSRWPREMLVATIFTFGTFGAVWLADAQRTLDFVAPAIVFALLCFANCCLIETWEWDQAPNRVARWVADHLLFVALLIAGGTAILEWMALLPGAFAFAVMLSGLALACLAGYRRAVPIRFVSPLADLALCSPILVFLGTWLS